MKAKEMFEEFFKPALENVKLNSKNKEFVTEFKNLDSTKSLQYQMKEMISMMM